MLGLPLHYAVLISKTKRLGVLNTPDNYLICDPFLPPGSSSRNLQKGDRMFMLRRLLCNPTDYSVTVQGKQFVSCNIWWSSFFWPLSITAIKRAFYFTHKCYSNTCEPPHYLVNKTNDRWGLSLLSSDAMCWHQIRSELCCGGCDAAQSILVPLVKTKCSLSVALMKAFKSCAIIVKMFLCAVYLLILPS